jgi:predicted RecA/RadA family phage recombinase
MKNYVAAGNVLAVTAPSALVSGQGVLIGSIFGIASGDAANGAEVLLAVDGIFDMAKTAAQAWTAGQLIYWSGTAATNVVATNKLIGVAVRAELAAATVGRVRLNAAAITP